MKEVIKERVLYLDILRIIACLLVLLTHSALPAVDLSQGKYYAFFSTLGVPSSELFLTISGATLLPVKRGFREFYTRRFTKLLYPFVIWSVVYIAYYYVMGYRDLNDTIVSFLLIPFKPVHGVFWFIYAICGLYLLAPFISKWIVNSTKKQIEFFLCLWLVTIVVPFLNYLMPGFYELNGSYYNMFNSFGGFVGYMVLGYYLRTYPIRFSSMGKCALICGLVTMALFLVVYTFKVSQWNEEILLDNLSLFSAIAVTVIITFFQHVAQLPYFTNKGDWFKECSKYTFGIYLVHILVIREFIWKGMEHCRLDAMIETPLICFMGFLLSCLLLKCLSKLPGSKYVVGF